MFKEKTSKKRLNITNNEKDNSTLDVMHNKMIKTFQQKQTEKHNYINQLNELSQSQAIIKSMIKSKQTLLDDIACHDLWTSNIKLTEDIIDIKTKLKDIDEFDEIEYYKKTSDILFSYYDMLEKQSRIQQYNAVSPKPATPNRTGNCRTILDALHNIGTSTQCVEDSHPYLPISSTLSTTDASLPVHMIDKSALVDEYLFMTSKNHIKKTNNDNLELCKCCKTQMICLQHDAIIICESCGYQELLLVEQNRPILKQNIKDTSHFSYKRINHFREWCNQVQGKESTDIPDEIFEKILNEIKKEKIIDTKTITYTKMREILKRLRINKYYEHINYIINRINGIPTPQFSSELEEKLCSMFRDIQGPFLKHCPKDRKNFLSYSYVLYKFFQILGLSEYLKYFPLLKSREKLYIQDQIWKKICEELSYEFIPSPSL
jgi:hypothetical protein